MKLCTYNQDRIGLIDADGVIDVTELSGIEPGFWPPVGMVRFIDRFDADAVKRAAVGRQRVPLDSVRLEAPLRWPNKVIAFPANYHAHVAEMKEGVVSKFKAGGQGFFLKSNSSLSGPADDIVLPPLAGREVHHECELGIVIGKRGRAISREASLDHIFGFTCLLDMVVRGQEERVMRKSFDTFCPTGPWIVTRDEVPDLTNIQMALTVNGEPRQAASTANLIVDIPEMIAMASAVMTLEPGDIIATGTPAGVGPVHDGDVLEIRIEGVGSMRLTARVGTLGEHSVWSAAKESTR